MRVSLAAVPVVVLTLAACGGGSSAGQASTGATSAPAVSSRAGQPGGPGNNAEFQKIRQCLSAAGISLPTPSGTPGRGTRPSGIPTGSPGARPSGGTGGYGGRPRGGPGRGMFASKEVQAALKACGITVPTGRPTASPTS